MRRRIRQQDRSMKLSMLSHGSIRYKCRNRKRTGFPNLELGKFLVETGGATVLESSTRPCLHGSMTYPKSTALPKTVKPWHPLHCFTVPNAIRFQQRKPKVAKIGATGGCFEPPVSFHFIHRKQEHWRAKTHASGTPSFARHSRRKNFVCRAFDSTASPGYRVRRILPNSSS